MSKLLLKIILVIDILALIILLVFSQFLIKYDIVSGITTDGFGRELSEAPAILRSTGLVGEWSGLGWYISDSLCAFALLGIAYLLFEVITDRK